MNRKEDIVAWHSGVQNEAQGGTDACYQASIDGIHHQHQDHRVGSASPINWAIIEVKHAWESNLRMPVRFFARVMHNEDAISASVTTALARAVYITYDILAKLANVLRPILH